MRKSKIGCLVTGCSEPFSRCLPIPSQNPLLFSQDPRNLVICFQLSAKISQTFPLTTFAEDAFEVIACYFPIDFNPPKNDPFGITREKLVDGLRNAMTASPLFAPYCLPLLIEKLSSDLSRCGAVIFVIWRRSKVTFS